MASTGAIPRTKKFTFPGSANFLPPDTQILVGHEASEPLEVKMLTVSSNGVQTKIPALHKSWCCPRQLIHFSLPPSEGLELQGALDAWLEQMDFFRQDLEWMLALPHHRFWSEVVHCRKVHACLESYLTQAPRWYDDAHHDVLTRAALQHGDVLKPVLADVHRLVLLVHVRMTTYKESKSCHITPAAFGSLLYDNYVLDVCQLLDLCSLYFPDNAPLLSKMITNVFEQQPSYSDDMRQVITSIQTALDNVEQRLGVSDSGTAVSLRCAPHVPDLDDLRAIVYYLLDTCCTLHAALQVYPPAAATMHEMELHIRLCVCYERCIPCLSTSLARHRLLSRSSSPASDSEAADNGGGEDTELVMRRLQQLRAAALAVFRGVIDVVCLAPLREDSASGHDVSKCLESYLHVVSSCLAEKTFIADYHTTYSFTTDIDLFKKRSIDATSLQFIAEAVHAVLEEMGVKEQEDSRAALCNGESVGPTDDSSGMSQYALHGSSEVDALQLTQLVSSVQDLMPGLGAGFITRCLRHYRYSAEAVINALLEDSLPPSLTNLDRSEAAVDVPPDVVVPDQEDATSGSKVQKNGVKETAVGEYCDSYEQNLNSAKLSVLDRANVYNDDEFDVFSARPVVDRTRVHRGKRKNKDAEAVPDDAVKQRVRDLGQQYEQRAGRSIYEDEEAAGRVSDGEQDEAWLPTVDYNDEYDDTYDDNEAGNLDATTEIMMPARRGRAHPAIFGKGALNAPLINGCESEEEEEGEAPIVGGGGGRRPLPAEENEEEFGRRRGLRKGLGGVDFMLELRDSGGSDTASRARPALERNLPASHDSQRKRHGQKRNLPPTYHRDHHRPAQLAQQDNGEEQETDESEEGAGDGHRLSFTPFCEDPAVARQRLADRYASRDAARNRGGNRGRRQPGLLPPPQPLPGDGRDIRDNDAPAGQVEDAPGGGSSGGRGGARPKTHNNAKSGKAWRHGTDEEARGSRGGKYKEDTNHGSAQDPNYRRKMEHKNKARKQAAQSKFNKNN